VDKMTPMSSNTLRTGKKVYKSTSNSPNFKGATAVRPGEALRDTQKRNGANIISAAKRRLGY